MIVIAKDSLCLSVEDAVNCENLDEKLEKRKSLGSILERSTNFDRLTNCVCYVSTGHVQLSDDVSAPAPQFPGGGDYSEICRKYEGSFCCSS